jgi:nucleotide-binding universal stress UspA family protein
LIEEGHASDKIAEVADAYDVDLVVLGAHGYGPVQKHFVGTTTDKIMTKVSRPLLTVKI